MPHMQGEVRIAAAFCSNSWGTWLMMTQVVLKTDLKNWHNMIRKYDQKACNYRKKI